MVSMPRKPLNWGDDLKDVDQISPPVTDPYAKVPALDSDRMPRGDAPDPATYAKLGELAGQMLTNDPGGDFQASGMMYNLGQQLAFHRGGPLDAQVRYGGSTPYANYAYGVYNAARGADLGDVLDLANLYGKLFSKYDFQKVKPDEIYQAIPAENVRNITKGFNDYRGGWVRPAR